MRRYNKLPDEQLLKMCSMGNVVCMDVLIERYQLNIKSFIFSKIKRIDIAEDVFQEVCLKVYISVISGKYKENGKFYSWLMRLANNLVMDQYRLSKKRNTKVVSDFQYDIISDVEYEYMEESLEDTIVYNQRLSELGSLIKRLPAEQQLVIELRHYADLKFEEIAKETNVSVNTALGRHRYGLCNLRNMMRKRECVCV